MKKIFLFLLLLFIELNIYSQSKWAIYLGEDMNSRYSKENTTLLYDNGYFLQCSFVAYPFVSLRRTDSSLTENTNRIGLILEAKSTTSHFETGEVIFGNNIDSVKIEFEYSLRIETHGRSALISIMNLFSKSEDKVKQDDPYDEVAEIVIKGTIVHRNNSYHYFHSRNKIRKRDKHWLEFEGDTLLLVPARNFKNTGKGKVKNKKNLYMGLQLMKGNQCVAALDFNESPKAFYMLKELSEKDKLIISAFMSVWNLKKDGVGWP